MNCDISGKNNERIWLGNTLEQWHWVIIVLVMFATASTFIWLFSRKWSKKKLVEPRGDQSAAEEQRRQSAKIDASNLKNIRELILTKSEAKGEIKLERKKAYMERPVQKVLRYILESGEKAEILPTYNPSFGFIYKIVESALDENVSPAEAEELLERLYHLEILEKGSFDTVSACPVCGSTSLTLHYHCPKCTNRHISKTGLTEHVPCGNIDERDKYNQGHLLPTCPKCGARLVEGEYRDMGLWYICRECEEKFEHPNLDLICRKCDNQFTIPKAIVRKISKYTLNPDKEQEIRQNVASLESINQLITELGFNVKMPASAIGEKSGIQHDFSLIAKKKFGDLEKIIAIDHAVGDIEVDASPLILYTYKISEVRVDLPIFLAIPKLSETAKKIAQGHNLLVIEGIPQNKKQLTILNDEIQKRLNERIIEDPDVHRLHQALKDTNHSS